MEVGAVQSFIKDDDRELCYLCSAGELQTLYGATQAATMPNSAPTQVNGNANAMTQPHNARAKRRSQLMDEHGTVVYVVKRTDNPEKGAILDHRNGDETKKIEIIEAVVGEDGNYYAKIVS